MPQPGRTLATAVANDVPIREVRLDLDAARRAVMSHARPLEVESVPLTDAEGRRLARPYLAATDLVPYARSAMDGYAVRASDTFAAAHSPLLVPVRGIGYAGDERAALEPGRAFAIATGGALPDGADAVVPWEDVDVRGNAIVVRAPLHSGDHVFRAGDDARAGEIVGRPGDRITPGRAAFLAAIGVACVDVRRAPRVTIVSTGNEIVDPSRDPAVGQVRDSNASMLAAHIARDGGRVVAFVHVRDTESAVSDALRHALRTSDLVITTGGASAGERDYVKRAATSLGATFAFTSVALRPAKPTGFARCCDAFVAVLPGNPAAAFVAYVALIGPLVRALGGDPEPHLATVDARLDGTIRAKPGRPFYVFARLAHDGRRFVATVLADQCSALVRTSADANAFAVIPPGDAHYLDGSTIQADVFDWSSVAFSQRNAARAH